MSSSTGGGAHEGGPPRRRLQPSRREVAEAPDKLKPGDVVHIPTGRNGARAVVLSFAHRGGDSRLKVVTDRRKVLTLGTADFDDAPSPLGHIDVPVPYAP